MKIATIAAAAMLASAWTASAALSLLEGTQPAGTTSFATAVGTFNFGNNKARLEAAGQTTVQGGNPGNGWWGDGTPTTPGTTPVRSWDVSWNNTLGTVTFNVYESADWTGAAAMTMTRNPVFTGANTIVGLDIGARLTATSQSVTIDNVQFDGGAGFVDVDTAEATYSGSAFFNDFHALLGGPLGDFKLKGTTLFPTGTTTGDSMRFFVDIRQGEATPVPEPTTMIAGALLLLPFAASMLRKLRKNQTA